MSNIRFKDIYLKDYTSEQIRDELNASYDGKRFMISKYNKKLYYKLKRFITRYNESHPESVTSFPEVVKVLTGKDYSVSTEEYHIAELKKAMDKDGTITYISKDTRSFLKNKYANRARRIGERDIHSISEVIAELIPGAKYVTNAQRSRQFSDKKTLIDSIKAVTNNNGCIEIIKDRSLKKYFLSLTEKNATTVEQELEKLGFKDFTVRMEVLDNTLVIEQHRKNILECADLNNNIVNLSKYYPSTHRYVCYMAANNKCSISYAINMLIGDVYQTYTFRGVHNKLSKYSFENPDFIGNDQKTKELIVKTIRECIDENNVVSGIYKNKLIFRIIEKMAKYNQMSKAEVYSYFVPEAIFIERDAPTMKHTTKEEVINNLEFFNDGSGCIDSIRKNKNAMKGLRRFAREEDLHISEFVDKYTDYYFTASRYEVDYIDFVVTQLINRYGYGGEISGLATDDLSLYDAVGRIKDFFPGGAKDSMEETFIALGFSYKGLKGETKFTEDYVRRLMRAYYGDAKVIESIYDNKEIGCAIINYSGRIGKSVKDTVEYLGYEYYNYNKSNKDRLRLRKMTLDEYRKYKNSQPGEEE